MKGKGGLGNRCNANERDEQQRILLRVLGVAEGQYTYI